MLSNPVLGWLAGTRKYFTPTCWTADALEFRPPIAPTLPSMSISPVTAMRWGPIRLPSVT